MSSSRSKIANKAIAIMAQGDAVIRPSKIPLPLRFPLLAILTFTLSSLSYSLFADFTTAQLVGVSRKLESWGEVIVLLGFRTVELALCWYNHLDAYDTASLTLLSHGPPLYLLSTFYEVKPSAAILSLVIDAVTTYIPVRLLRPLSLAHAASSSKHAVTVPNNEIVTATSIQAYTTILAATIYAVTLLAAYKTYLPVYLVTYFNDIPSIAAAHAADLLTLFPVTFLLGLASRSFIFTPAVTAAPSTGDAKASSFNPETASFAETFWHNAWGFDKRTKVVIQRTATIALVSGANTFLQTLLTVNGVEAAGAAAYSGVWVIAAGITGAALGAVGA